MKLNTEALQQLMREIRKTILDDIAETMHDLGFIGGSRLDASKLIGQVPIGSARIIVQYNGTQIGDPTYILNFLGDGFVITADPANNRINIGLAFANGPINIVDDALDDLTDDADVLLYAG